MADTWGHNYKAGSSDLNLKAVKYNNGHMWTLPGPIFSSCNIFLAWENKGGINDKKLCGKN